MTSTYERISKTNRKSKIHRILSTNAIQCLLSQILLYVILIYQWTEQKRQKSLFLWDFIFF